MTRSCYNTPLQLGQLSRSFLLLSYGLCFVTTSLKLQPSKAYACLADLGSTGLASLLDTAVFFCVHCAGK